MTKAKPAKAPANPTTQSKKKVLVIAPAEPTSKIDGIITLLKRPKGATLDELMKATGWQRHSIHGTLSGTIKKKRGLPLITEFGEHGRSYRLGSR